MQKFFIAIVISATAFFGAAFSGCNFTASDNQPSSNPSTAGKSQSNSAKPANAANKFNGAAKFVLTKKFTDNLREDFKIPTDEVGDRMLREYGALFVAQGKIVLPVTPVFKDAAEVSSWQAGVAAVTENIGGFDVTLQGTAMNALQEAIAEAKGQSLTITPRGKDASKRNYEETEELWASRVNPGLEHWVKQGKLAPADADRIKAMTPFAQVSEIFKLEQEKIFFSKDLKKPIMYSVAPPGTSQHLSMLALDVTEHDNAKVREVLAKHGWFQTVVSDLPHFTYLGMQESELTQRGLIKLEDAGRVYWAPDSISSE